MFCLMPLWRVRLPAYIGVLLVLLALALPGTPSQAQATAGPVYIVEVQSTVTSAMISYLRRSIQLAEAANANALIITLSSNGGVLRELRPLATEIVQARVPVVVYIAPAGTQAGAPGAFFMSAAHLNALAPNTSFGSPFPLTEIDQALSEQTRALVLDSVADQLRDWNKARGRNAGWVDLAVREGAILNNEQAINAQPPAIDLVAADRDQLLTLLNGRRVTLENGAQVQLETLGRPLTPITPTLVESIWLALAEPTMVFALMVLGALAIYLELAAPSSTLFLGVGAVLLLAATAGLVALPFRWWALALLVLALVLIGLEFVVSSHGGLAIAGLALLAIGGLNLIDPVQAPGASVGGWSVFGVVSGLATLIAAGLWLALRTRVQPVATGQEALVGRIAEVRRRLDPQGMVFVDGALWQAVSQGEPVEAGDWVRITAVHQLRLIVERIEPEG